MSLVEVMRPAERVAVVTLKRSGFACRAALRAC